MIKIVTDYGRTVLIDPEAIRSVYEYEGKVIVNFEEGNEVRNVKTEELIGSIEKRINEAKAKK